MGPQSFMAAIQQANAALSDRQAQQDALNQGQVAGQQMVNDRSGQVASDMVNQPLAQVQNRSAQGDPGFMAQLEALIKMGPQTTDGKGGDTRWQTANKNHMNEKYRRDYLNEIANLSGMADLMRRPLTDVERQQQQDAANLGHMQAGQQLMAGTQARQINDPTLLGQAIKGAGDIGVANEQAAGLVGAADMRGRGEAAASMAQGQSELQKQALANQGAIDLEKQKLAGTATADQKKADEEYNKQFIPLANSLVGLKSAAASAIPEFISAADDYFNSENKAKGLSALGKIDSAINASREALYGKDYVKSNLADPKATKGDPELAKASIADALVDNILKLEIASEVKDAAAQQGIKVKAGSIGFGDLVTTIAGKVDPERINAIRSKVLQENPSLMSPADVDRIAYEKEKARRMAIAAQQSPQGQGAN